ncbi:hypothetical protein B0H13DRAFT_1915715 [Mycena leptocephala]|nr:hypothetical protein B0H13DRAFT_1915715 [Mycena leptocephala]
MYRVISDYCANERGSHRAVIGSFPESVVFVTTKIKSRQSEVSTTRTYSQGRTEVETRNHEALDTDTVLRDWCNSNQVTNYAYEYGYRLPRVSNKRRSMKRLGVQYFEFRPPATVPKVDIVRGKELHLGWNPSPET